MRPLPLTSHFWLTRSRRILVMSSLILVFLVCAPAILLYTAGYRYDWPTHRLLGTGVISLDLKPNDANVYVNDLKLNKKMPIRLSNSAPGVYHVRIEKPGYHSWRQDLTVTSNQTTFIRDVQLYRASEPTPVRSDISGVIAAHTTPNPNLLAVTRTTETAYAVDYVYTNGTIKTLIASSSLNTQPEVLISPTKNAALIITHETMGKRLTFVNLNEPDTRTLGWIPATSTLAYQWAPDEADTLYIELNHKIIAHRVGATNDELIAVSTSSAWFIDEHTEMWHTRGNDLWHIRQGKDRLAASTSKPIIKILAINAQRALVRHADGFSAITFGDSNHVTVETHDLTQLTYFPEHDEWLAWSAWELWSVYSDGHTALLLRATDPIKSVTPLDKFGVLLVASQKGLDAFNPGYYVTERLADIDALDSIAVNQTARLIYFVGTVKNRSGLYKLEY